MRIFPGDFPKNRNTFSNYVAARWGTGTLTGVGHGYGVNSGRGFGRGMENYPHQLIQYWT